MPQLNQLGSKLSVIIDFSVKDNHQRTVFIPNGLPACGEIDDAEPPHAKTPVPLRVNSFIVRPAMGKGLGHLLKEGVAVPNPGAQVSCDAAHGSSFMLTIS